MNLSLSKEWSPPIQADLLKKTMWSGNMGIHDRDEDGFTALMISVEWCERTESMPELGLVKALIEEGADIYAEGLDGRTLWSHTIDMDLIPNYLLKRWDIRHLNSRGESYLHEWWDDPHMVSFLSERALKNDQRMSREKQHQKVIEFIKPHLVRLWQSDMSHRSINSQGESLLDVIEFSLECSKQEIEILYAEFEQDKFLKLSSGFSKEDSKIPKGPKTRL